MNILFVGYSSLNCNSGLHIFHLANKLTEIGHECVVFVPEGKALTTENGACDFVTMEYDDFNAVEYLYSNKLGPDVIHAWTPREIVREFVTDILLQRFGCPYLVHLEDNEEHIFAKSYGARFVQNCDIDVPLHVSHPVRYKQFISNSSGVTVLTEKLLEFKPEKLPGQVIWPGYDSIFSDLKVNNDLKNKLGIQDSNTVIVYMGNVHDSNRREVHSLYLAVYILNRRGVPVTLIRTGEDYVHVVSEDLPELSEYCIELGYLPRKELPDLLSIADILVQPGSSNEFNDYRFPSKLPDFLVSGKPVILPDTNIGKSMESGTNCMLLDKGDAVDIAKNIEWLLEHEKIAAEIGRQGKAFAKKSLTWGLAASKVEELYRRLGVNNDCGKLKKIH